MSIPYRISASRSSAILGLSPYMTPVQVWLQIMEENFPGFCNDNNFELPIIEDNPSMVFGRGFEDALVYITEKNNGIKITDREKSFIKKDYISCHVDGISESLLIENKSTSEFFFNDNFGEENTDQVPINYQLQVQHALYCTGLKDCLMTVLVFPKRPDKMIEDGIDIDTIDKIKWIEILNEMKYIKTFKIQANKKLQSSMVKKYKDFWFNNVLKKIPPEPIDISDIKSLVREPSGTIIADESIERQMSEYKNITEEIGQGGSLRKRANQIRLDVLQYMKSAEKKLDDDSDQKWILRGSDGKKIATYGKNKAGEMYFR